MNDDLSASLAARDLHLRRKMQNASGEERLAAMQVLMERARVLLELNPEGMRHFLKRNFKARAIANATPAKRVGHDR